MVIMTNVSQTLNLLGGKNAVDSSPVYSCDYINAFSLRKRKIFDFTLFYLIENRIISFGFGNTAGLSFADLASKSSEDFAFGSKGEFN